MNIVKTRKSRKQRIRKKIRAVSKRPRLTIFRTNEHIWAQIIDDEKGVTLVQANDKQLDTKKATKIEKAEKVGENIAQSALDKKIKKIALDRGRYRYHGRIKALAEAARKGGLEF